MPTYEYVCKSCGEKLEVFQSFSAKPLKKHKECGGDLQKVFHARGVVFKGSGFYKTDSRKSSDANGAAKTEKADSKADSKSDSPSKNGSDSKPAKKETAKVSKSTDSSSD